MYDISLNKRFIIIMIKYKIVKKHIQLQNIDLFIDYASIYWLVELIG